MEDVLTVCDGIGAVHEAWRPLGWNFVLSSEIDPFPRAVLKIRQHAVDAKIWRCTPDRDDIVPLWGDFTALRIRHLVRLGVRLPSLLAGGTPCQAFSVAGLRKSLGDARGNLTLSFVRLADAIDNVRRARGERPIVIVWENVPGVLSVKDNAFGCFLAGLVGADAPLVPPGQPGRNGKPGKPGKWTDAGLVVGPQRTAAWRIVDAQYFGLAQRRRRVFVVASARKGFDPAAVLFEPEGVQRDSPPRRETGQGTAASLTASSGGISQKDGIDGRVVGTLAGGGRRNGGFSYDDVPITADVLAFGGNNTSGPIEITPALLAQPGSGWKGDFESETFITYPLGEMETAHTLRGEGFDASEDGTGRGTGLVPVFSDSQAYNLSPGAGSDGAPSAVPADVAAALTGEGEASKNGRGTHVIAFGSKDSGGDAEVELSPTLRAGGHANSHANSHANAGVPPAVAFVQNSRSEVRLIDGDGGIVGALAADAGAQQQNYVAIPILESGKRTGASATDRKAGDGIGADGDSMFTLGTDSRHAIAFALRGREDGALPEIHDDGDSVGALRAADGGSSRDYVAGFTVSENADGFAWEGEVSATLQARSESAGANQFSGVRVESSARRLTPMECERLQGYRDFYTQIPWKGRAPEECPDGPRYKALGNSMAVPCMVWIGERIEAEETRSLAEGFE